MTNIPITRSRSKICYECDRDLYPKGKPIFDDELAKQDSKGNWHCSDCQLTERRKTLLKVYGPNHVNTRYFLEHEDKKIRAWNQLAKQLGTGPYRKNKYTGRTPF
jgi:Zn-finger protein